MKVEAVEVNPITTTHRCEPVPITVADHASLVTRILSAPPKCSRCRSRKVYTWASLRGNIRYERQCLRCITWSRATRSDSLRCLDCRRWVDPAIEALSEEDREFYRRYGGRGIRRCQACNGSKLTREQRQRESDGQYNPLSPYFEG
jgi:hypothetical protein